MIQPKAFIETLRAGGVEFFAGVPDSLLKNLCAYITDTVARENNIIADLPKSYSIPCCHLWMKMFIIFQCCLLSVGVENRECMTNRNM